MYAVATITIQLFLNELILQDHTLVLIKRIKYYIFYTRSDKLVPYTSYKPLIPQLIKTRTALKR